MNHKWLKYCLLLCAGWVLPARAQIEFTNVSDAITNLGSLYGVTSGGASNSTFVAAGANASVATWTFPHLAGGANQNTNWVSTNLPGGNQLNVVTFGTNQFLASGANNIVFSSADGVNWSNNGTVFANSANVEGLAFNEGSFVTVASAPEISWSTTATNWTSASISGLSFADSFRHTS